MLQNLQGLFRTTAVILLVLIPVVTVVANDNAETLENYMLKCHERGLFNGSVLVAEEGKVIFSQGFGYANMEWKVPNDRETKFRLASVSKQFISMLAMIYVQEDKIKLDDAISEYLPDYRKDNGEKVTVYHLMTNSSGIPDFNTEFWQNSCRDPHNIDELISKHCRGDLEFEPGARFKYSNAGYVVLGRILEQAGDKPLGESLQEKIFGPLGMENSGLERQADVVENLASGYNPGFKGHNRADFINIDNAYSAGGLYSTVDDLLKWDQALYTNKLIKKKLKEKYFTPYHKNYACGWGITYHKFPAEEDSIQVIRHSGGIQGFNTIIARLPKDKYTVILLANSTGVPLSQMTSSLINILYGKSYEQPKKSIINVLEQIVMDEDVDAAVEKYHALKTDSSDYYSFGEGELNMVGYFLLGREEIDGAIKVFQLNVEMFPDASNPYDSLAEAYMSKGEKKLAIENYAKSLTLNPGNTNAIRMMNKIISD